MKKIYYILGGIAVIVVATVLVLLTIDMAQPKVQKLSGRTFEIQHTVLDAVATSTWGKEYRVDDYDHIVFDVSCYNNSTLTVKFGGSDSVPDDVNFANAQSVTNHWDYIQMINLMDGSSISGDTGFSCAGSADYVRLVVNDDLVTTINAYVSSYTAGTTTVKIKYNTNQ